MGLKAETNELSLQHTTMKTDNIKDLGITSNSHVLIAYPHPDDEAFSVCGLMQKFVKENINFKLIIFTRGEASTLRYGLKDNEDLGLARKKEFKCFTKTIGIKNTEMFNFGDKQIELKYREVQTAFKKLILEYKPTHVLTYEPCGIYGHPDHIALTKIIEESNESFKLIYSTVPKSFKLDSSTLNMAKEPEKIKPLEPNLILKLNFSEGLKKVKALNCYKSQMGIGKKTLVGTIKYLPQIVKLLVLFRNEYFFIQKS